jgi:NAD(P)-dependent dehydrogenase (short-subunit alcohol dehydrogenase family)
MDLKDRVAVVTGGASGIGAAVAADLRAEGVRVVVWDLAKSADIRCDMRNPDSIEAAIKATTADEGVPSLLVACAGINNRSTYLDTPLDDWDKIFEVNVRGTYLCTRVVAREMIAAGLDGAMVLTASTAGILTDPGSVPYALSKASIIHLAGLAAVELGQHNIRVNAVAPGPTETPMAAGNLSKPDYRQLVIDTTPLRGIGTPPLLSQAIVGLLKMDWVTGQTLTVDGGTSLVTPRGAKRASLGAFQAGAHLQQAIG